MSFYIAIKYGTSVNKKILIVIVIVVAAVAIPFCYIHYFSVVH